MSATQFSSIVEQLQRNANVRTVYGDPIEKGEKTVVPVARVAFGFGGGFGQSHDVEATGGDSEGGGLGGGSVATPVGALEITDGRTRFVRFGARKRSLAVLVAGLLVGLLVGRQSNRE